MGKVGRILVVSLIALSASVVRADEKAVAKKAFREGSAQYDLGNYGEALALFKKAYLSFSEPSILFNMAQCQRQLGDKVEAVKLYRSYLRNMPDAPNRAEVEATIARLDKAIADENAAKEQERIAKEEAARRSASPQTAVVEPTAAVAVHAPPPRKTPVYKKWWLWTAVGGAAVAVGLGVGLGIGLTRTTSFDATLGPLGPGTSTK